MEMNKYSERDIQDYANGSFDGDLGDFENFLKENPSASVMVTEYKMLFKSLGEQEMPVLTFNLADTVLAKITEKEFVKERQQFTILSSFLILITIGSLIAIFRYLHFARFISLSLNTSWFILSALLIVIFSIAFYRLDVKQMERRLYS